MQCTPEPHVFVNGDKERPCYDGCFDSGYSGLFCTPQSITTDGELALGEETPKENLHFPATPKDKTGHSTTKDTRAACWCETPKLNKKDASLQYRLAVCKSILDSKTSNEKSPRKKSLSVSGQWISTSLDSLETVIGTLATSTLSPDRDLPLSGRKRRLFSQIRTSTLDDGTLNPEQLSGFNGRVSLSDTGFNESCSPIIKTPTETPRTNSFPTSFKKNLQSPICNGTNNSFDSSVLCTPSGLQTPKYTRSTSEDSGFSSLTLDKSEDLSVDHDGSFQELLLSATKGNSVTPNFLDTKRRSWLQRQSRLSTLKEGGSHSDDDLTGVNNQEQDLKDEEEVFSVAATPLRVLPLKLGNLVSSDGVASTKRDFATPLRRSSVKGDVKTPLNSGSLISETTPSSNTPINLSLTPALELVYSMCQQKTELLSGQSPSLKDELRFTSALVKTPVMFRTTMPLAGLIGRNIGVGTFDILTELNKRNLKHILSRIMGHLSPEFLYRCGRVCKSWRNIIQQDRRASLRRRSHLSELNNSEQVVVSHTPEVDTRAALPQRSALKTVQAQSRIICTPQSGSRSLTPLHNSTLHSGSSSKREKFLEVAKTLFNDEFLKPCPRCQHPARCHSVKGEGLCSNADCAFQFCTSCLCAFHGSKECGSRSVNRRKKDNLFPGSAQSKRNVKRL